MAIGGHVPKRNYPIAEAKDQLPALVHAAEERGPVDITRRGERVAVLVSAREYDRLASGRRGFSAALDQFRKTHDLAELDAAEWHARERARLASIGRTVPFADGQIAAVARVNDMVVVTANVGDFEVFRGVEVEDWRE